jgi:hypothetical protein
MITQRQPRYSKEEFAQRGGQIYDLHIRPKVETMHKGKFVALDIDSGAWEMDADALTACDRLIACKPDSQTWLVHVGYPYLHRIGGHRLHNLEMIRQHRFTPSTGAPTAVELLREDRAR